MKLDYADDQIPDWVAQEEAAPVTQAEAAGVAPVAQVEVVKQPVLGAASKPAIRIVKARKTAGNSTQPTHPSLYKINRICLPRRAK